MSVISRLGGSLFGISAEEFSDELESVLRVIHLGQCLEDETIEGLCLFDGRVPCLQVLFDSVQVGWQVLKVLDRNTALDQVDEDGVAVLAGGNETMEQVAQSTSSSKLVHQMLLKHLD